MNISDLKKIIHEEVVKAMREELREILLEAVTVHEQDSTAGTGLGQQSVSFSKTVQENQNSEQTSSIVGLLQETAKSMGKEDYKNLTTQTMQQESLAGFPDFISAAAMRAKAVFDASNKKTFKNGI